MMMMQRTSGNMRLAGCCGEGQLTNALPTSFFQLNVSPFKLAKAHVGQSTATVRLNGLIASVSSALSSPSPAAAMEGGMSTALAASARLAKRPSLLGDMVECVNGRKEKRGIRRKGQRFGCEERKQRKAMLIWFVARRVILSLGCACTCAKCLVNVS